MKHSFRLELPAWTRSFSSRVGEPHTTLQSRMELVLELTARNVEAGTGGPFGAAVFSEPGGYLVAIGVNVVLPSACSLAHAEIMALGLAQTALGTYDLGAQGLRHQLVTSSEPCAMCFGAIPWSGIHSLVCGARAADAEAVGFDEGPKPRTWVQSLEQRGIEVIRDVLRPAAAEILRDCARRGGAIYNSRPDR